VGFGSGIERLVLNLKERGAEVPPGPQLSVYVAHIGPDTEDAALLLTHRLRAAGVAADMAVGERSVGAQLKHANSAGARFAAVIGEDELRQNLVTLQDMATRERRQVPADDVLDIVAGPPD
jgi:histidyl-tRNA synthetase